MLKNVTALATGASIQPRTSPKYESKIAMIFALLTFSPDNLRRRGAELQAKLLLQLLRLLELLYLTRTLERRLQALLGCK